MNYRIRQIRDSLDFSRAEFGKRIGVSGVVVNNLERGRVDAKDHIVKLICSEFGVNEEWLRTGAGEMFRQDSESLLDRLAAEYKMSTRERAVITAFLKLDEDGRSAILQYVDNLVTELYPEVALSKDNKTKPRKQKKAPDEMTREDIIAELERQLDEEKETQNTSPVFGPGNFDTAAG